MKVFISWSGQQSRAVASALRDWLPDVIQRIDPWMSSQDIDKGQRWSPEIASKLEETGEGIVCVTPDNIDAPWLNFEAGALAKSLETARVRPFLVGLDITQLKGPLAEFQATVGSERDDVLSMLTSLNDGCEESLSQDALVRAFERTWDEFSGKLASLPTGKGPVRKATKRTTDDLLSEVLQRVRAIERELEEGTRLRDLELREETLRRKRLARERAAARREATHGRSDLEGTGVLHREFGRGRILEVSPESDQALVEFRDEEGPRVLELGDPNLKIMGRRLES